MNPYRYLCQLPDPDGTEVAEWVDSVDEWVDSVDELARIGGPSRSRRLFPIQLVHHTGAAVVMVPNARAAKRS